MQSIEAVRRKIKNAEDLLGVVKTMKSLAAVNIRQYERAVESLGEYARTVETGLHALLLGQERQLPCTAAGHEGHVGAVVFGSDQGLCGQFNERIVAFAHEELTSLCRGPRPALQVTVGARAAVLLEDADRPSTHLLLTPAGLPGITPLIQDLLLILEPARARGQVDRVVVYHNRPLGGAAYAPAAVQLLPLDLAWLRTRTRQRWPARGLPAHSMAWPRLFSALVRQQMFVVCFRACAESMAAEEASRLASMQNAERNIEDRLNELTHQYHHLRQDLITAELLDIVAGFEAVTGAIA
jgi:F-type H+-transporting ATPase subunit gamma